VENEVEFRVVAKLENLAVVRTLIGAVGTFEDLDMDTVADLRLAVDEACTRLIRSAVPGSTLIVVVRPQDDDVVIDASTTCTSPDIMAPGNQVVSLLARPTPALTSFRPRGGPFPARSVHSQLRRGMHHEFGNL